MSSLRQALETHPRLDQALAQLAAGRHQRDAGIDPVRAARKQPQAVGAPRRDVSALGRMRRPTATTVSAARMKLGSRLGFLGKHVVRLLGLGHRQALGQRARVLGPHRAFVDICREQPVGLDAGLLQQLDAAGRTRGKHKLLQIAQSKIL
jgi:hypothetical protein